MLQLKNLSKSYGKKKALNRFSATLGTGVFALLGPNGAGKSTLMNIISGNLPPDSGRVLWNGEDTRKLGADFRNILGFMPQQQRLYDSFTGAEFLCYIGALKGLSKKEAASEAERCLNAVNMTEEAGKRLRAYSGGMKQRILIAQAIMGDPKLLIFDEPTAGLDPRERIRIKNLISRISADKTVIIATHVVPDVEYIAREALMLKKGNLIAHDSPANLCLQMEGRVFEVSCNADEAEYFLPRYCVSAISQSSNKTLLRILNETAPENCDARAVQPTLEDVYLWAFGDTEVQNASDKI
ncbi:MAG: ABC transporter ATP-binding protein [Ruminococcaceae bacterium]|nr:ABC transporter ATP-binding protein [Oscillospiraceae bacterium]